MKKLNKLGTVALSMAVMATSTFASPIVQGQVSANVDTDGKIMSIEKMLSTYEMDDQGNVTIPVAKANSGVVDTKVYPLYSSEPVDATLDGDNLTFEAKYSAYKVVYSINGVEKSFVINVELTKAKLSFAENTNVFLPSTSAKDKTLLIPYPVITDDNDKPLLDRDGVEYDEKELVSADNLTITVYSPNGTVLTDTEVDVEKPIGTVEESSTTYIDTIKYLQFTPKTFGTYTVKYAFKMDGTTDAELTKQVKISNNVTTQRDISFKITALPSAEIGEEYKLPKPTVTDVTNDIEGIESYTNITVKCIQKDGTVKDVDVNGFKFTPLFVGDYIVTYEVFDVYGNVAPKATYQISNVKDTKAPHDIKLVNDYEFDAQGLEDLEDYSYKLQSRMSTGEDLIIPAVYAVDNDPANALENFVVTRSVKLLSTSAEAIKIEDVPFNKVATLTMDRAGTYTVSYSIYDKEGGNVATANYTVIVMDNYEDIVKPEITFETAVAKKAKVGDTISFKKPTAVDYRDGNGNAGDARLFLKTYYIEGEAGDVDFADQSNWVEIQQDEKDINKLSFVVPETNSPKITVFAVCFDDYQNIEIVPYEVGIINDTTAPSIDSVNDYEATYVQGEEITIPTITVTDNYINGVTAKVEVFFEGNIVNTYGMNYYIDEYDVMSISNAKFYPIQSGEYNIFVTIKDVNNNVTIYTDTITVERAVTNVPVIKTTTDLITADLGDDVDLNIFAVYDDGKLVSADKVVVKVNGAVVDDNIYKATTITAVDDPIIAQFIYEYEVNGNPETVVKEVKIQVTATTAPTITFNTDPYTAVVYKDNVAINLALPVVQSKYDVACRLDIEISLNGKVQQTFENVTGAQSYTPDKKGSYQIKYIASDGLGNSAEKSFTIAVGDQTGPVIDLGDESVNAPATKKKGSTLTLDTSKIDIYDVYTNEQINIKDSSKVTVTLQDSNKTVINNTSTDGFSWELNNVGTYTLTYVAKDSNGNKSTVTKSIEVSDDVVDKTTESDVGMVLAIIGALIVLAGVIIFFFKPEKSSKDKKDKK